MLDAEVCRSEECEIEEEHTRSLCRAGRHGGVLQPPVKVSKRPVWLKDDPEGLQESVRRAVPKTLPTNFSAIVDKVTNDYGSVTERTIYRHVRRLVERGELLKLNLQLGFAAYARPTSKLIADLGSMREIMTGLVDIEPNTP